MKVRCYFINTKINSEVLTEADTSDHVVVRGVDESGNTVLIPWTALASCVIEKEAEE